MSICLYSPNPLIHKHSGYILWLDFCRYTEPFHAGKHEILGCKAMRLIYEYLSSSDKSSRVQLSKERVKWSNFRVLWSKNRARSSKNWVRLALFVFSLSCCDHLLISLHTIFLPVFGGRDIHFTSENPGKGKDIAEAGFFCDFDNSELGVQQHILSNG